MDPERIEALIDAGRDDATARLAAGQAWLGAGQPGRAVAHLRRAVELAPELSAGWQWLGKACLDSGDTAGARTAWERGIEVAASRGDRQAQRVMQVWLRRLDRAG
ncbi:MAG: hypothetical protein Kow0020_00500 [Wenzhouxiangellaceae bacterium]